MSSRSRGVRSTAQVSADVVHCFRESQWYSSQQIIPKKDGSLLVTFTADGLEEVA